LCGNTVTEVAPKSTKVSEPVTESPEPINPSKVPDTDATPESNPKDEDYEKETHDD